MHTAPSISTIKSSLAGVLASHNGRGLPLPATLPQNGTLPPVPWEAIDQAHRDFQALVGELISFKDGRHAGAAIDVERLGEAGFEVYGDLTWGDLRAGRGGVLVRRFEGWPLVVGMVRGGLFRKAPDDLHAGDVSF